MTINSKVVRTLTSCRPTPSIIRPLRADWATVNKPDQVHPHVRAFQTIPSRCSKSANPDVSEWETVAHSAEPPQQTNEDAGRKRFADFDLAGKTFIMTGGARGLGLALAEALVEAGGKGKLCAYPSLSRDSFPRLIKFSILSGPGPDQGDAWEQARARAVSEWGGC
ncbi:uncharacterized protein BCR38DRAFT_431124 [Pseudomassariella vexata]|uniref:Uncharacterized protein n=1 Tax=Pseudomassariella vexata TaxID=1141098 RepID=A0A1Y2E041_9PEZI|nr:uncharacterized protein BCR38DRAFT_431124 [Pseudomassariella vexata]ORY64849.1 hypothetical protein BCR38DRAFT_431124 [Pseudomassariella vexata]